MTHDEIFEKITEVLVEALGVDDDEVTPEATLVGDLGAESIDFLDIVFRLEKAFEIKIDQAELFPDKILQDPQYVQDGKITDAGLAELKNRLPHADLSPIEDSRSVDDVPQVFTVDAITKFVEARVAG